MSEQVVIPVPGAPTSDNATTGNSIGVTGQALVGETAEFYELTRTIAVGINGHTIGLLSLLRFITLHPATSRVGTTRVWGPYTPGGLDPLTHRLTVTRFQPGQFTFSLDARLKSSTADSDFVAILDGMITRGVQRRTGKGSMTMHFDNRRRLLPESCEGGTIAFAFDNTGASATLDVMAAQFGNVNPQRPICSGEAPHDAAYHFDRAGDGAGNFVFAAQKNIHKVNESKPNLEDFSIRSRWRADGAGRSDVKITGGEVTPDLASGGLTETAVTASQCWNTTFKTVFQTSSPAQLNLIPTQGDMGQCAFTSAMLP